MSLRVTSGIVTVASGATAPQTVSINASPVNVFSASGNPITDFSGAINVNISGGTLTTTVNPFGFQSGTAVVISGGNTGLSGLYVIVSGGAGSPNISGGVTVSGIVGVSGGAAGLSGLNVIISGGTSAAKANPTYSLSVATTSGGAGVGLLGLYNAGVGTKLVEITRIQIFPVSGVGTTGSLIWDVVRTSGAMSGTAVSPVAFDSTDPASVVSGFTVASGAVTSILARFGLNLMSGSAAGATPNPIDARFGEIANSKKLLLNSGEGLMVRQISGASTVPYPVYLEYQESTSGGATTYGASLIVTVSGVSVTGGGQVSGAVRVSGTIYVNQATAFFTSSVSIPANSGGTFLASQAVLQASFKADYNNAGIIYMNASGAANSGIGVPLRVGNSVGPAFVSNLNIHSFYATVSGDKMLYAAWG